MPLISKINILQIPAVKMVFDRDMQHIRGISIVNR